MANLNHKQKKRRGRPPLPRRFAAPFLTHGDMDALEQHVGDRIKHLRYMTGTTLKDMGMALGVSYQQIQKYETGDNRITAARLFLLAAALGVSLDELFADMPTAIAAQIPHTRNRPAQPQIRSRQVEKAIHDLVRLITTIEGEKK